jgi:hypothetical protein
LNLVANVDDERWATSTSRWMATYDNDECQPVLCGIKDTASNASHRKD